MANRFYTLAIYFFCLLGLKFDVGTSISTDGLRNLRSRDVRIDVDGIELVGRDWSGEQWGEVVTFLDVPYSPPACPNCALPRFARSDSLRWKEGVTSPLMANGEGSKKACTQVDIYHPLFQPAEFSEDCFYLDIYVPRDAIDGKKKSLRNVLVFIHGGSGIVGYKGQNGFFSYASRKTYKDVSKKDLPIVVSLNYRLGHFGFLRHPELQPDQWLNGYYDNIEGLKWIQANIANFGGDASKVTIMGQSFGGGIIGVLTRMKSAKGLFKGAIPISGFGFGAVNDPSSNTSKVGVEEFNAKLKDQAADENTTIFNVDAGFLLSYPEDLKSLDKFGLYVDKEEIPWFSGDLGFGRHDGDVPVLAIAMDQELRGYPGDGYVVKKGEKDTIENARIWSNAWTKAKPAYLQCLMAKSERFELSNGVDSLVALFRAVNDVEHTKSGGVLMLRNRTKSTYTATVIDLDLNLRPLIYRPNNGLHPQHSSTLMGGSSADLPPWNFYINKSPETIEETLPAFPVPKKKISKLKDIKKKANNPSVYDMIHKAVFDFILHGKPDWKSDQHAHFQPTRNNKPVIVPSINEKVQLLQQFNKCSSSCIDVAPTETLPSETECKHVLEERNCICVF